MKRGERPQLSGLLAPPSPEVRTRSSPPTVDAALGVAVLSSEADSAASCAAHSTAFDHGTGPASSFHETTGAPSSPPIDASGPWVCACWAEG